MSVNLRNAVSATAAQWADALPRHLEEGETCVESDTGKTKTGPGLWADLPYDPGTAGTSGTPIVVPVADESTEIILSVTNPSTPDPITITAHHAVEDGGLLMNIGVGGALIQFREDGTGAVQFYLTGLTDLTAGTIEGDFDVAAGNTVRDGTAGFVCFSPDATAWRIKVANDGSLSTELVA